MVSLQEGGKRKNIPQDTVDKFVHQLLLIEDPQERVRVVNEINDIIRQKNAEASQKNIKEQIMGKRNYNWTLKESRIADYMTEKYGEDPENWDFDNTPIDEFSDEDLDEFESPITDDIDRGPLFQSADGSTYDGDLDDTEALEAWMDEHEAPGMDEEDPGDDWDELDNLEIDYEDQGILDQYEAPDMDFGDENEEF